MSEKKPSRRALVASLAAAGGVAVVLNAAAAQVQSDSDLIRLGDDFDRLHAEFARIKNELRPIHDAFEDKIEAFRRRGEWPSDGWLKLRRGMGVEAAITQENAAIGQVNAVTHLVRSVPAKSIAGMAVKMKILAYELGFTEAFRGPESEIEWPEQCFLELLREAEGHSNAA